jgi:hypothetical protein
VPALNAVCSIEGCAWDERGTAFGAGAPACDPAAVDRGEDRRPGCRIAARLDEHYAELRDAEA